MKFKIYLFCLTLFTLSAVKKSLAAEYYSDPASSSVILANGTNASTGWSTSASGPFGSVTITAADDLIIQSGSTVTTSGATNINCKNLTINGTLVSSTTTAVLRFVGLFSGNGVLNGTQRLWANGVCTFSFNGSGTNGVQLYGNATLVGNTYLGVLTFSAAPPVFINLDLNGFNLTVGTFISGASTSGGNNNNIFFKGHPNSNLSIGTLGTATFSHLYFDQSVPGSTNSLNSLTTNSGLSLYTTMVIYDFVNHKIGSSFFANAIGINSQAGTSTTGLISLASTSTKTAYILSPNASLREVSTNSLKPTIRIQQYIPSGFRKFRFLAHPFSSSMSLAQLVDSIDITGAGGNTNGFTTTATNNPSAFSFNTSNANGGTPNDAGWSPFTSANTATWASGQGIRVLVRGKKGQAGTLNGSNATPEAVTLSLSGVINNGNVTINLSDAGSGATAGFNLVGNPYPSPVDLGTVVDAASNVVKTIYLRNPQTGSYITQAITGPYIIPAYTSFFIKATAPTSLAFTEARKAPCVTCATVFSESTKRQIIELKALQNGLEYDNLFVMIDDKASANYEVENDAVKLNNDLLNIYTISNDNKQLAVDYRSLKAANIIPIGISLPLNAGKQTFTIQVNKLNLPNNVKYELVDKINGTRISLVEGGSFTIEIDPANPESIGSERLQLQAVYDNSVLPDVVNNEVNVNVLANAFSIQFKKIDTNSKVSMKLLSSNGKIIEQFQLGTQQSGRISIPTQSLAKGLYIVEMNFGNERIVKKIINP